MFQVKIEIGTKLGSEGLIDKVQGQLLILSTDITWNSTDNSHFKRQLRP